MAATQPNFTEPIFLTFDDLCANSKLTDQIAILCNAAFTRPKSLNPAKWEVPAIRFPDTQTLLDMVGKDGIMAIILDESWVSGDDEDIRVEVGGGEGGEVKRGKLVVTTTIVPWAGGQDKEGAGTEPGYEMKAVCVDGDARYLRKGLAIKVMDALENYIIEVERKQMRHKGDDADAKQPNCAMKDGNKRVLTLWILAAEDLVGSYWRKTGYENVRSAIYSGIWGCRTSFELMVLKKEVEYSLE